MKKVFSIALSALLLVSCTKDINSPGSRFTNMSASMDDYVFGNEAIVKKDTAAFEGMWSWEGSFTDSVASSMTVIFNEESGPKESHGNIQFQCNLNPPTFKDGRYSGTGTWTITHAEGDLEGKFNEANGDLTYYEQEPSADNPDDPIYRNMEFTGVTDK